MTWWGAVVWTQWLGTINFAGASDWRLPASPQPDYSCDDEYDPGDSYPLQYNGYNCTGSDLGNLFYTQGGLTAGESILASATLNGLFDNMLAAVYWSAQDYEPDPGHAWMFQPDGFQDIDGKAFQNYAWAVRSGEVAQTPLPATGWLMALGLAGLSTRRQGRG